MDSGTIWFIIFGMAVVTYLPRLLPFIFLNQENIHPLFQRILKNVPYAALGALIFPGILSIQDNIWFGIAGGLVALVVSYLGAPLVVVVISAVLALSVLASLFS